MTLVHAIDVTTFVNMELSEMTREARLKKMDDLRKALPATLAGDSFLNGQKQMA